MRPSVVIFAIVIFQLHRPGIPFAGVVLLLQMSRALQSDFSANSTERSKGVSPNKLIYVRELKNVARARRETIKTLVSPWPRSYYFKFRPPANFTFVRYLISRQFPASEPVKNRSSPCARTHHPVCMYVRQKYTSRTLATPRYRFQISI